MDSVGGYGGGASAFYDTVPKFSIAAIRAAAPPQPSTDPDRYANEDRFQYRATHQRGHSIQSRTARHATSNTSGYAYRHLTGHRLPAARTIATHHTHMIGTQPSSSVHATRVTPLLAATFSTDADGELDDPDMGLGKSSRAEAVEIVKNADGIGVAGGGDGRVLALDKKERKKIVPLAVMMFLALFNYTILRSTKDVLMVTAPKSGAEVIPFLKMFVNLPGAAIFSIVYSKMSNTMSQEKIFYTTLSGFIGFFAAFAFILYPARAFLHPNLLCDALAAALPLGFAAPIAILRNWTFSLFYLMAELWGSTVIAIIFWGFANQICTVVEAEKYYPPLILFGNIGLIFAGQYVKLVSSLREGLSAAADPWGVSLKLLMGGVAASGGILMAVYSYMQRKVLTDPNMVDTKQQRQSKTRTKMGLRKSISFLSKQSYIRNMAVMVTTYAMAVNLVEVSWKAQLKLAYPNPNAYSAFMGNFATVTGLSTMAMMTISPTIFKRFGWGTAALMTPVTLLTTGAAFFSLTMFPNQWGPLCAALGTTPLMLSVLVGSIQNAMTKSSKYSLFDPAKEQAYIPLDHESRIKGKAAIDGIGMPLGKSAGGLLQQLLILTMGSLTTATPVLGAGLFGVVGLCLHATQSLAVDFKQKRAEHDSNLPRDLNG